MLTQDRLRDVLHYDPDTWVFTWKMPGSGVRVGSVAGSVMRCGYIIIGIDRAVHLAHRLAFLYVEGSFPSAEVDHIDHCRSNNRWSNLRPATRSDNSKNTRISTRNTSGYKGVSWHSHGSAWVARAMLNGKSHHLGYFPTAEAASEAYEAFARKHHGEFYHPTRQDHSQSIKVS